MSIGDVGAGVISISESATSVRERHVTSTRES